MSRLTHYHLRKPRLLWLCSLWVLLIVTFGLAACKPKPSIQETPMSAIQTEIFKWSINVSNYNVDAGSVKIVTLAAPDNWFKDASGKEVTRWFGAGGMWGVGGTPMGGNNIKSALPKTFGLAYYDYIENKFYELVGELEQRKIYELFKQQTVDNDNHLGAIIPRYKKLILGIAPQGHIMVWVSSENGADQVELASYRATERKGVTVASYNASQSSDFFHIRTDYWAKDIEHGGIRKLKAETTAKIKAGWLPSADYYLRKQRIKYPWRYSMSGNARLVEFSERLGNTERNTVYPWEFSLKQNLAQLKGVPREATLYFNDKAGKRHYVALHFFRKDRVSTEPDLTEVFAAFEKLFPGRTLEQNHDYPAEAEMATLDINVSDDLTEYTATLIKGNQRIDFPLAFAQRQDLSPYAYWTNAETPEPAVLKLLLNGPPK
jgi:hypothetical protein